MSDVSKADAALVRFPIVDRSNSERPTTWSSDRMMMGSVAIGDEQSCRVLVDRLIDRMFRLVTYLAGSELDADDLVQVTLLRIINAADTYRGESSIETWADRIAVRIVYKHLKKSSRREEIYASHVTPEDPPSNPLDEAMYRRQLYHRLAEHLQTIPLERRTTFLLRHLHGYSVSEISEITETPINTVRDRLRVARKEMRRKLVIDPVFKDWAEKMSI